MQESSCESWAVGEGGEQGLMQLTSDKCQDAPGGNCQDPVRERSDRSIRLTQRLEELQHHDWGQVLR